MAHSKPGLMDHNGADAPGSIPTIYSNHAVGVAELNRYERGILKLNKVKERFNLKECTIFVVLNI